MSVRSLSVMALLVLAACEGVPLTKEAERADNCKAWGYTPGTDAFTRCIAAQGGSVVVTH